MFPTPPPPDINNIMPTIGWGSPSIWVPLASSVLVAVLALAGVIITNIVTGKNMFQAETQRAEAALAAEAKRAGAALEAELLRHDNALTQRNIEWQREAKTAAYANLALVCQEMMTCYSSIYLDIKKLQEREFSQDARDGLFAKLSDVNENMLKVRSHTQIIGHPDRKSVV